MSARQISPCRFQRGVILLTALSALTSFAATSSSAQDKQSQTEVGRPGGRITVALRTDPKTLNPILAVDATSREVIGTMQADLVHINRETQRTEPALASSWKVSPDGRKYTLALRRDVKFSDGASFTADDVVFTSPVAIRVLGGDGVVRGKEALRRYWSEGIRLIPDLRFEVLAVYVGISTLVINYRNQAGGVVSEVLTFDGPLVREGHGTYLAQV